MTQNGGRRSLNQAALSEIWLEFRAHPAIELKSKLNSCFL